MIIFSAINIKELFEKGRQYLWKKPEQCLHCKSCKLWGHGFVTVFFEGFLTPFFLKRYRCPDCHKVFRVRPEGYFKRFSASRDTILESIKTKEEKGGWLGGISNSRQRHWFRALQRHSKAFLGDGWDKSLVKAFEVLSNQGLVPVTRAI